MRIQGRDAVLQAVVSRVSGNGPRQAGGADAPAAQEDSLTLSPPARDVQRVRDHLATLPDVREERVADLRARIERGDYHVSDEDLADSILQSGALDLPADYII